VVTAVGDDGSVSPEGINIVDEGDSFSATFTADAGSLIESIQYYLDNFTTTNNIAITNNVEQVVTMDAINTNMVIGATFTNAIMSSYTIYITNNNPEHGTITPSTTTNVAAGDNITVSSTGNTGYSAVAVLNSGFPMTNHIVNIHIQDVTEDWTVVVDFILGNVISSNSVNVSSTWLQHYGLALTQTNADAYWEAYLGDVNPTNGSFEIISAEVIDGTNYIKWISEGQTPDLPPFNVLVSSGPSESGLWGLYHIERPTSFTTNVFKDAENIYYKLNASTDVY
jgi:hypothetical protein